MEAVAWPVGYPQAPGTTAEPTGWSSGGSAAAVGGRRGCAEVGIGAEGQHQPVHGVVDRGDGRGDLLCDQGGGGLLARRVAHDGLLHRRAVADAGHHEPAGGQEVARLGGQPFRADAVEDLDRDVARPQHRDLGLRRHVEDRRVREAGPQDAGLVVGDDHGGAVDRGEVAGRGVGRQPRTRKATGRARELQHLDDPEARVRGHRAARRGRDAEQPRHVDEGVGRDHLTGQRLQEALLARDAAEVVVDVAGTHEADGLAAVEDGAPRGQVHAGEDVHEWLIEEDRNAADRVDDPREAEEVDLGVAVDRDPGGLGDRLHEARRPADGVRRVDPALGALAVGDEEVAGERQDRCAPAGRRQQEDRVGALPVDDLGAERLQLFGCEALAAVAADDQHVGGAGGAGQACHLGTADAARGDHTEGGGADERHDGHHQRQRQQRLGDPPPRDPTAAPAPQHGAGVVAGPVAAPALVVGAVQLLAVAEQPRAEPLFTHRCHRIAGGR